MAELHDTCIDIHADDYALSPHSDEDILKLCRLGKLDSLSIMPNMACCDNALAALKNEAPGFPVEMKFSIHLNFMEGKCCAEPSRLPHLVDADGYFTSSWGKLLLWNYNPFLRRTIQKELAAEIIAQTERLVQSGVFGTAPLRFDSHQHTHAIPLVLNALCTAIAERGWKVAYIRNTEDPLHLYLGKLRLYPTYSPLNAMKCCILNWYAGRVKRALKKLCLPANLLCGVFFSSQMDGKRLAAVLPAFKRAAQRKGRTLEILFHPGTALPEELGREFTKRGFNEFHLGHGRSIEYNTVLKEI